MLTQAFPQLKNNFIIACIRDFFRSPAYAAVIVFLMVVSETQSLELPVYDCYLALLLLGCLFTEDTLCIVPIACCGYMTLSAPNSPVKNAQSTAFGDPSFVIHFVFVFSMALFLLAAKLVMLCITRYHRSGEKPPVPRLWAGFVALGVSYMLGGAFSPHYSWATFGFGLMQFLSLTLLYAYFCITVDWKRVKKSYFAALFLLIGLGMCVEIADMYTLDGVIVNGVIDRDKMYVGWGVYNNVACIMAMCIPAPCYFAVKVKRGGWLFTLLTTVFLGATVLTQSRGGMLFGSIVYLVSILYVLLSVRGRARQGHLAVLIALLLLFFVCGVLLREKIDALFASIIKVGMSSSGRVRIYKACWETFLQNPWFGVGFYDTPGVSFDEFLHFMSPRAHNTILQLLATGGLTCFLTYCYHRIQTMILLFRKRSHEKAFVTLSILALLLTSLLDCNFFNFGPAIIYGILLASAEGFENVPRRKTLLTPLGGGEPDFGIARAGYFSR